MGTIQNLATGVGLVGVLCVSSLAGATAGIINVPGDFATIQQAIDDPGTGVGDTVVVAANVYGPIDFKGKPITVRSTNPLDPSVIDATIIDGGDSSTGVKFVTGEGPDSVLEGFLIQHGRATNGGGIMCLGTSPTIRHNRINDNRAATAGGGIFCGAGAAPTIEQNIISLNHDPYNYLERPDEGGGIFSVDSSPRILRNRIINNAAELSGAGICCRNGSPIITGNVLKWCYGTDTGSPGIYCDHATAQITGNTISENGGAANGGGIGAVNGASLTIRDNVIVGNDGNAGGAISVCNSAATITGNTLNANEASRDYGGGVYFSDATGSIIGNRIAGNWASDYGGGVACHGCSPLIASNVISGNTGSADGGGIDVRYSATPTIEGNDIDGNCTYGGGGGITVYKGANVTIRQTLITNNCAAMGGGVSVWEASATLTNCTIAHNNGSRGCGGGVELDSPAAACTLRNCIIAFHRDGDGVLLRGSGPPPVITYCNAFGNVDGNYGGLPDPTGTNGNVSVNPLFVDPSTHCYRLKSLTGRFDPDSGTWLTDSAHSPCIDAGDPLNPFGLEPDPNGGRINMGYDGNTAYASLSRDTQAPTVAFRSLRSRSACQTAELVVLGVARDNLGVARVKVRVGMGAWQDAHAGPPYPSVERWDARVKLATGANTVRARVRDCAGLVATRTVTVYRDTQVPTVAITKPANGAHVSRANCLVRGSAGDSIGLKKVELRVGTGAWTRVWARAWAKSANWRKAVTLAPGRNVLAARATDMSGRRKTVRRTVWLDSAADVALTAVTAQPTRIGGVQLTFGLSGAAVVRAEVTNIAGRPVATVELTRELPQGLQTLVWNGRDSAGLPVPNGTYVVRLQARSGSGSTATGVAMACVRR